ncbi:D21 class N6 adenine-specific DNA methyltransferase signature [Acididesulfobacillus acetoxydans]|uniref:D21 class N6 adenine-specific DNA methyltransferase signature n=1 Tax=Acididesulfobacillus acetoxydans TaxID=1561005 RepID=A0A8S0XW80_9FIRM|nr:site-specific DNA-methyltransferase [Acididesulfobacillus acetoxydans]CAA7600857.1 D21 class N6 adenine-specific DNA methyltransferase signature [Acididesulfobacillus acetoxydans]CEJ07206.1 Type III restriction-modification system EcoPI enzyme mod [Acididesulfobacillus acetoxydans]
MNNPEKLAMRTPSLADEKFAALANLFPNAVTETIDENGSVVRAIDKDVLAQEINAHVVEGREERYQFTWPDKRKSILLANTPIAAALRPCREESVDFDTTENLYIEGDNLDVLKLLRETYLNRVKMIYIDPPYNTSNDFVYNDDFSEDTDSFLSRDGQFDEQGNRLVRNLDSNGRFHTDWLNMIYPRLRVARDLLTDDGVIFISIGDEEASNLIKVCNEVFGEANFRNQIVVRRGAKSVQAQFDTWDKLGQGLEYILLYTKNPTYRFPKQMKMLDEAKQGGWNNHWRGTDRPTMRYPLFGITPPSGQWRWGKERSDKAIENYQRMLNETHKTQETIMDNEIDKWYISQKDGTLDLLRLSRNGKPEHYIAPTNETLLNSSWVDLLIGSSSEITKLFDTAVFDTAKLTAVIKRMLGFVDKDSIILDFFSGSATTAHAVMQLNAEDGGKRKFIMVQLPEICAENSEAVKVGYKTICEIGKERIRRAGAKIKDSNQGPQVDTGFRVLKLDSSNMKEVYYAPDEFLTTAQKQQSLFGFMDNIKEDRSDEDLLFQVMLDLGIPLSGKITQNSDVFSVNDNYLIACFKQVDTALITEIAKKKPYYAVFRDSSFVNDSAMVNFEQVFATYSPNTIRRVL